MCAHSLVQAAAPSRTAKALPLPTPTILFSSLYSLATCLCYYTSLLFLYLSIMSACLIYLPESDMTLPSLSLTYLSKLSPKDCCFPFPIPNRCAHCIPYSPVGRSLLWSEENSSLE